MLTPALEETCALPRLDARLHRFLDELDRREGYIAGHSIAVCDMAIRIAHALDLAEGEIPPLAFGALLHDIGKVFIDNALLAKAGPLTEPELATIRLHPALGEALLCTSVAEDGILEIVRFHHERWDGGGYPDGLAGAAIPLGARIVATADAFVAMRETRAYRTALQFDEALEELTALGGTQFDDECVEALLESVA